MMEYVYDAWQSVVEGFESLKELDMTALVISFVVSMILWAMMWGLPWWKTIPIKNKIIISIAAPFIFYVVAKIRLDKG